MIFFIRLLSVPNPRCFCNFNRHAGGAGKSISGCRFGKIRLSSGVAMLKFFLRYWLPVVAWLAVIFFASADAHSYEHSGVFVSKIFEPVMRWFFPKLSAARMECVARNPRRRRDRRAKPNRGLTCPAVGREITGNRWRQRSRRKRPQ